MLLPEYANGLEYQTQRIDEAHKLIGILNGMDKVFYNPAKDKALFETYDKKSFEKKAVNKEELQDMLGLPVDKNIPMIGMVSRLVAHKGLDYVKTVFEKLIDWFIELKDDKTSKISVMNDSFYDLLRTDLFLLSSREKCFNAVQAMQSKALELFTNDHDRVIVNDVFSKYFRRMTFSSTLPADVARIRNERMQGVINRQVGEVFLIENEREIPYEQLLGSLKGIGFKKSLLYLFQGNIKNYGTPEWMPPASILLKAILDEDGLRALPEAKQLLRTESIFQNEFIKGDGRRTMIVAPMFVGADIYGLLELKATILAILSPSIRIL